MDQQFRAAVHHTVAKICEEEAVKRGVSLDRGLVAVIANLAFEYCGILAQDLEMFAEHGRRHVINVDDVLLAARKNPDLVEKLRAFMAKENIVPPSEAAKRKRKAVADGAAELDAGGEDAAAGAAEKAPKPRKGGGGGGGKKKAATATTAASAAAAAAEVDAEDSDME